MRGRSRSENLDHYSAPFLQCGFTMYEMGIVISCWLFETRKLDVDVERLVDNLTTIDGSVAGLANMFETAAAYYGRKITARRK